MLNYKETHHKMELCCYVDESHPIPKPYIDKKIDVFMCTSLQPYCLSVGMGYGLLAYNGLLCYLDMVYF